MPTLSSLNSSAAKNTYFLDLLKNIHSSDAYFLGNYAKQYEYELAQYFGSLYAINIDSKVTSIINVLKGHEIGVGDEIICTSFGMSKTVNALLQKKIVPVLADLNPSQYSMSFEHCKRLINPKTKAIILSYPFGIPNQAHLFKDLARQHKILLIEDIQSSFGSFWRDQKLGTFADVAFFDSHPKNQLCPSQAGLCVTDHTHIAKMVRPNIEQPYSVLHELSEFLGALGLSNLNELDNKLSHLQQIHTVYSNYLSGTPNITIYQDDSQSIASKHVIPLRVHAEERNFFYNSLKKHCHFIYKDFEAAHNNALINVMLRPPHLPNTEKALQEIVLLNITQEESLLEHVAVAEKIQTLSETYSLSA
ncbi:MAG TPA: DegT/DnrJ/EryC1/StrS family aminotransferase [Oligoflexia bacterium]|nr:DegT/DnrJ/EryC1/StrS family aminotransferase [Oligoflexia bacterium]HMR24538.1 DegT/DnrJ/EryC1/StrS family aminotransferase [Oligoflexia bacterium]